MSSPRDDLTQLLHRWAHGDRVALDELIPLIYKELHKLRQYRNKVHIQLDIEGASRDEDTAFSDDICTWALKLNVQVLKYLNDRYPRPEHLKSYATPLSLPSP